jgi:hypothetical protein
LPWRALTVWGGRRVVTFEGAMSDEGQATDGVEERPGLGTSIAIKTFCEQFSVA